MTSVLRPVLMLFLSVFLLMAGVGTLTTVLGVRMADAAAAPLAIGIVMAGYFAGQTAGSLRAFTMIRGVGHIRAFSALASILSAATLAHVLSGDLVLWGVLRFVEGFCVAGLFVCVESWLNQNAKAETRGRILSIYMICLYGGQGLGQFLLTLEPGGEGETGLRLFVILSMVVSVALVPVALTRQTPPTLPDITAFGVRRLYAASPLGMFGTLVSGLVTGSLYSLGPVYTRLLGYDNAETATFMSAAILGGTLLQWPLGLLSDIFDRRKVLVGLFVALAAVSAGLAVAGDAGFPWLLAGAALFGGITYALYPVSVAHTNDHLDARDMVSASGGLILGYSIGATIGPFAASGAISATGAGGLFVFCGAIGALAVAFGLWRMVARAPVPADQQSAYRPLPRTTPVAGPLDPRATMEDGPGSPA